MLLAAVSTARGSSHAELISKVWFVHFTWARTLVAEDIEGGSSPIAMVVVATVHFKPYSVDCQEQTFYLGI